MRTSEFPILAIGVFMDAEKVARELLMLRSKIADLDARLTEAERRPEEILQEIDRLWHSDPEIDEEL
jgi:hypothetical protein